MSSERAAARRRWSVLLAVALAALALPSPSSPQQVDNGDGRRFYPDDPLQSDPDRLAVDPETLREHEVSEYYDYLANTLGDPGGPPGPARNVNTLGEVPDSSWFRNRIGAGGLTVQEVVRGPNRVEGPAPGTLTIVGRPGAGITPKFIIRDARGDRYLIKLDPVDWQGLSSTAELISTKVLWAIGYHTPENYVFHLDPDRLLIDPEATWEDWTGREREIRAEDLQEWLKGQRRDGEGRIRVLASRYLAGLPVGSYAFYGIRSDDPNDIFPHEYRRELRGLRAFSAWINHDDARGLNTHVSLVQEDDRVFVRRHLIDFGSTLGSGSVFAQEARAGYEYYIEVDKVLRRMVGLGFLSEPWEHVVYPEYPSVGRFEADFYEPWRWKPQYPHPAFDRMDAADGFWAASIMAAFTPEMLEGIVEEADMRDPEARAFLRRTLQRRLDKSVAYWLTRTNPLDGFVVEGRPEGAVLHWDNAAVRADAASSDERYRIEWLALDNLADRERSVRGPEPISEPRSPIPAAAWGPPDDVGYRYAVARIGVERPDYPHWEEPVAVAVRDRGGRLDVVGISRPTKTPEHARRRPD